MAMIRKVQLINSRGWPCLRATTQMFFGQTFWFLVRKNSIDRKLCTKHDGMQSPDRLENMAMRKFPNIIMELLTLEGLLVGVDGKMWTL